MSMREMLEEKLARFEELERMLSDPVVLADSSKMTAVAREHGSLGRLAKKIRDFKSIQKQIQEAQEMVDGDDPEMAELAGAELPELKTSVEQLWQDLLDMTIGGEDANRTRCVMEIRAGAGGDEAALFAGNLFAMYKKHCETKGWKVEVLNSNATELGGFKEIQLALEGDGIFRELQVRERWPSRATRARDRD